MSSTNVSTKQERIAELAREHPDWVFTTLAHHIDLEWLREAYRRTRKDAATGIDGVTASEYEEDLEGNLRSLLGRAKSGTYRAPPVRRVYIPKGSGKDLRPLGIPTLEDKVLQRAVVMVLEPLYEQEFLPCSYGFRPGRSPHQALKQLWHEVMRCGQETWIIDLDVRKFFDTVDHSHLQAILRQRVRDGVLLRLIGKWLHAGVWESGQVSYPGEGTPQGGVISPLLANIYLHEVLDRWFLRDVRLCIGSRAALLRFADDAVLVFASERDARRVLAVLPKRLAKYGLTLHPEKTRLVPFSRPSDDRGEGKGPGSFDFLGFTHFWAKSRKGRWLVTRKTAKGRLQRALQTISAWCRRVRHEPVGQQHAGFVAKLRGHAAYYGLTGNSASLSRFWEEATRAWRYWLSRRDQRRRYSWERFHRLLEAWPLPRPRIVHSWVVS